MAKKNKKKWKGPIYVERALLDSKAYRKLKKTRSVPVLLDFLGKRQMKHIGRGGKKKWTCVNNGKIEFPYNEAEKKGYSRRQFNESKRELVEHGFIDVSDEGGVYDGNTAKYSISERWRKFGTPEFIFKTIPKDTRKDRGWTRHHEKESEKFWENIRRRKRRKKKLKIKRRKK
jgi:hypothetical protein